MSDTSPADKEKRLYAEWEEQGCFETERPWMAILTRL